jgi:cellulose synthase/poly-beta-1,6-N-acetylglucosamine synthase-like glycosyltransferase
MAWKARGYKPEQLGEVDGSSGPLVTVQLPIYNEKYVVNRLIDAVASQNYPRDKMEIQILDDSTDDTTALAEKAVVGLKSQGYVVELLHRNDRVGFKGGALENGLRTAKGEFIAIFDADFVPRSDYLNRALTPS